MSNLEVGIMTGIVAGGISVATMIPMQFPDKRAALLAAFSSRFAVGLFSCTSALPIEAVVRGALIGFIISVPDAIITKAYAPIMILGTLLGAGAGWALKMWGTI
jgi:hypothetical protein